jgi:hypothetical protein
MITVWCMNTGGHAPDSEVRLLERQVAVHLKEPHIFQCISEHHIDGIYNVQPINDLPGWWGKINLFNMRLSHSRNLWLDLDTVITGSLDEIVRPLSGSQLRCGLNWAASDLGSCQSSMMYWEGNSAEVISESFDHSDAHWPPMETAWSKGHPQCGDQEWISYLRDTGQLKVEYFTAPELRSYKYHCLGGLPPDTRVVAFHGRPKPAEVSDGWVKEARS